MILSTHFSELRKSKTSAHDSPHVGQRLGRPVLSAQGTHTVCMTPTFFSCGNTGGASAT